MALDGLKFGNFKPQQVYPEARALPGYGGPTAWADYKFQVAALVAREERISEKLGPLPLRLVERLQGPALQVAKQLGIETLTQEDGVKRLLAALETELLPLRRQAAMELYNAGLIPQGVMSRQHGESMSSYLLRREAWWTQLRELDDTLQVSEAILGEQTLGQAGLQPLEVQMVRTVCKNDLNKKDLYRALRDQFGQIQDREKTSKGYRGYGKSGGKGSWSHGSRNYGTSYMAAEEQDYQEAPEVSEAADTDYQTGEWPEEEEYEGYYDEEVGQELSTVEETVVCWYAEQGISAQTCSQEDLDMVIDAVEAEQMAYFTKGQAHRRGLSVPASSSYQLSTGMSPTDRQSKVLAAKQRSRCRACNQMGHWKDDPICPKKRRKRKELLQRWRKQRIDKRKGQERKATRRPRQWISITHQSSDSVLLCQR